MAQHFVSRGLPAAAFLAGALGAGSVLAGPIEGVKGEYGVYAYAQAYTVTDEEKFQGTLSQPSFSIGAQADASYADPLTDLHTAYGAGGVNWNQSAPNVLSAGVGGLAEAFSYGLDTAATGTGSLKLYFDLTTQVKASLMYEGTFDSQLYRLEGGNWQQVASWVAWEDFELAAGSYRWDGSAGENVTGSSAYSSGMFFTLTVTPVPELPSVLMAMTGLVLLGARLKRR